MVKLLHSVPNHPWIGLMIFDSSQRPGLEFRGIVEEVSDSGKEETVYVRMIYNDGEMDYAYIKRDATVKEGVISIP